MKKKALFSAMLISSLFAFQALATGPTPDELGEFYVYYDEEGNGVGRASMDCEGNIGGGGQVTENYYHGYFSCE